MKKSILTLPTMILTLTLIAQTPTEQDCLGAIFVNQPIYIQNNSFSGEGNYPNEINTAGCPASCLLVGEKNDVWYILHIQSIGNLCFSIIPNNSSDDYDWAVYNLTNASCSEIYSNSTLQVSCNFSSTSGITGANGGDSLTCAGAIDPSENLVIPVVAGETYVINVSNFSESQNGYTLDFTCSTTILTSIENEQKEKNDILLVSPNPANDYVDIQFYSRKHTSYTFKIFDQNGKLLIEQPTEEGSYAEISSCKISTKQLSTGSYYIMLFSNNNVMGCSQFYISR